MKISQRTINDLLTLISHARRDISYEQGGTYNTGADGEDFDTKEAKASERAIDFIKELILTKN